MRLTRIYTKTGDAGTTALASGDRVSKSDRRIEIYGTVDELNAHVGVLVSAMDQFLEKNIWLDVSHQTLSLSLRTSFIRIQNELFDLGAELATPREKLALDRQRVVTHEDVKDLEKEIDEISGFLSPLRNFVLPGPGMLNAQAHVCRTVCRRAERLLVSCLSDLNLRSECLVYLNRLSDWFFVVSRWLSTIQGKSENLWLQKKPASTKGTP